MFLQTNQQIVGNYQIHSILDALRSQVDIQGERTAFTFLETDELRKSITYRELDDRARSIAAALLEPAHPGDRAHLLYSSGLDFIEASLGCIFAEIIAVPAYPPRKNRTEERILAIANDCQPRLLLCTSNSFQSIDLAFLDTMSRAVAVKTDELRLRAFSQLPPVRSDQIAFLQYTSGSTSEPKGMVITHGNITANEEVIQKNLCHASAIRGSHPSYGIRINPERQFVDSVVSLGHGYAW